MHIRRKCNLIYFIIEIDKIEGDLHFHPIYDESQYESYTHINIYAYTHIYTYTLIFIVVAIIHFKSILYIYIYEYNSNKEKHQFDSGREHVIDGCWEWPVVGKGGRK